MSFLAVVLAMTVLFPVRGAALLLFPVLTDVFGAFTGHTTILIRWSVKICLNGIGINFDNALKFPGFFIFTITVMKSKFLIKLSFRLFKRKVFKTNCLAGVESKTNDGY